MSPDAVVGLLHLGDRFNVMVLHLLHLPLPELPLMPGRRIVAPKPPTVEEDAEQRDAEAQADAVWRSLAAGQSDHEGADHD